MSVKMSTKLIGKQFGQLTVVKDTGRRTNSGQIIFQMKCDCGRSDDYEVARDCFDREKGTRRCPLCRVESKTQGYGEITGTWWGQHFIKRQVGNNPSGWKNKRKGNEYRKRVYQTDLTAKLAWELFIQQKRKCALTGIELFFPKKEWGGTASLDRVDSKKDYLLDNVQWVHKDINIMKNSMTQEQFIIWCKLVAKKNK